MKDSDMDKPTKSASKKCHDYHKIRDYLQEKYGYDERDYDGKLKAHDRTGQLLADRLGVDWPAWRMKQFAKMEGPDAVLRDSLRQLEAQHQYKYLDFWHWVVKNYDIRNHCYITFTRDRLREIQEDWVKEIYARYIDEFADEDGTLPMYVWW